MEYGMAENGPHLPGEQSASKAFVKLVLVVLLRRSLVSSQARVESLSVLGDPAVARAFALMAERPNARHSLDALAQSVGLSRSGFMARFNTAFGESPMAVLRRIRLRHAAVLLAASALSIDQVAKQQVTEAEAASPGCSASIMIQTPRLPCECSARARTALCDGFAGCDP
jgi:AraC family transcriptional activator of mtrCDE